MAVSYGIPLESIRKMATETKHYALIGKHLGHSWSQRWFEAMFAREGLEGHSYTLHEMPTLDGLRQWICREHILGFNVTIPYKQAIMPMLDSVSREADAIGAVNCVVVGGGRLVGHNTDAPAFAQTLPANAPGNAALILGTGGAAQAVAYALKTLGIKYQMVSRHPSGDAIGYSEANLRAREFDILVNATPAGMWPDVDSTPWPYGLEGFGLVYDLVYNPSPTLLLRQAAAAGAATVDGLAMLQRQAELSWQLWRQQ